MKILIDIGHPAQVHYFRNFMNIMESKGHSCFVTARNKEVTFELLNYFCIDYKSRGKGGKGSFGKLLYIFKADYIIFKYARVIQPDLFLSFGSTYAGHVAFLFRKPHIVFDDTDNATLELLMYSPFADSILTPACYKKNLGKKQIRFDGFIELCYLYPKYFKPDPAILQLLGLKPEEKYILLRFVSWNATHDIGHTGMSLDFRHALINILSKKWKVFISSETPLTEEFQKYKLNVPPDRIHDVLAYCTLFIGEGATMASECAILGTPSIYINSISPGTLEEHEQYGLLYGYRNSEGVLEKALQILNSQNIKEENQKCRQKMLNEKIDVTALMVWFIENYPESAEILRTNPDYQYSFK